MNSSGKERLGEVAAELKRTIQVRVYLGVRRVPLGPWGQKTRTSHLLRYSQQLQAGIEGNLGRRQSPQISPSQDKFPTIRASAQLTHGGIS